MAKYVITPAEYFECANALSIDAMRRARRPGQENAARYQREAARHYRAKARELLKGEAAPAG